LETSVFSFSQPLRISVLYVCLIRLLFYITSPPMRTHTQTGAVVAEASNDADAVLVHTFDLDFVRYLWFSVLLPCIYVMGCYMIRVHCFIMTMHILM
jgi:hypothetical protein